VPVGEAPEKVAVRIENSCPLDPADCTPDNVMLAGNVPSLPWAQLGLQRACLITAVPVAEVGPQELQRIWVATDDPSPHASRMVAGW